MRPPPAAAAPGPLPAAQTYAELLDPIPDAVSRLKTRWGDGDLSLTADERPVVELAEYHPHHHHHHWWHWRHHHLGGIGVIITTIIIIITTDASRLLCAGSLRSGGEGFAAKAKLKFPKDDGVSKDANHFSDCAGRVQPPRPECGDRVPSNTVLVADVHSLSDESVFRLS